MGERLRSRWLRPPRWCASGAAIWNNDGDTALLLDPNGNVVDAVSE